MAKTKSLVRPLLGWFARNARDLPWRRTSDPYAIWISEIMLQQTQVKTVIPYWKRWMRRFPTVQLLARAELDQVLKAWEGLGYYTRARNLHLAAQAIASRQGGAFPSEFDAVLALPGIGRYTAGAICSIAFNQPTPVLDGNVIRVLTRVFALSGNPADRITREQLWTLAGSLVAQAMHSSPVTAENCGDFNQALMELGATVCTPKQPDCPKCPWRKHCLARQSNRVAELPNLESRPRSKRRRVVAFVLLNRGRVLIRQRPDGVANARLWEFPNCEIRAERIGQNCRFDDRTLEELAEKCVGFRTSSVQHFCQLKHTITRYRIQLDVYHARSVQRLCPAGDGARWCGLAALDKLAFPSAHRKIVNALKTKAGLSKRNGLYRCNSSRFYASLR